MPTLQASDRTVPVTVRRRIAAAPHAVFDVIAPIDLTRIFRGWGPFPAVIRTEDQSGPWNATGRTRTPRLGDGSTAREELTEYAPPHSFAYELSGFTNTLRHLVTVVRGEWTFAPDGEGTSVTWTYEFAPIRGRGWMVRAVIAPMWRRYAVQALRECDAAVAEARSHLTPEAGAGRSPLAA